MSMEGGNMKQRDFLADSQSNTVTGWSFIAQIIFTAVVAYFMRFVLSKFGFHEGRFISALPSKWVSEVYAQFDNLPDGLDKERCKELIRKTKNQGCIVGSGMSFDPHKPWHSNAISYNDEFAGILVSSETLCDKQSGKCKSIDEIDDSFFGSSRSAEITPTVDAFTKVSEKLLLASQEVFLVDPYFRFSNKFNIELLKSFVEIGSKGRCKIFRIFTDNSENIEYIKDVLNQSFRYSDVEIEVNLIDRRKSKHDFHDRHVFSILGGLDFGKGLSSGNSGQLDHEIKDRFVMYVDKKKLDTLLSWYRWNEDALFEIAKPYVFRGRLPLL